MAASTPSIKVRRPPSAQDLARPRLELDGGLLAEALRTLIEGCEPLGGVERYVAALKLKANLFAEAFAGGAPNLTRQGFLQLCTFMPTVRRRIALYVDDAHFPAMRDALGKLLDGDPLSVDARVAAFCANYRQDKEHRFIRDVAAEVLHNFSPENYPLMARWIWDHGANSGVIRELWHGDDVDHMKIDVPDGYATHLILREELAAWLTRNGVFADVLHYVDMVCAQVYANYICAQGGTYLRTDFSAPEDPMRHTRRMLGLDGVRPGSNKTRLKAIDGEAFVIDDASFLS